MRYLLSTLLLISNLSFAQDGKFNEFTYKCADGVDRPYIIYSPENIDNNTSTPLLVYLHGSISSPALKENPLEYIKKSKLITLADKGNFRLMFPYGQKGATWFDTVGVGMILGEINAVKKAFSVDENKIFLSGFSDGASGVFYISMTNPSSFAGFIAMNGSLKVAEKLSDHQLFLANANHKPLYVINTKNDMLYDIEQITPTINYLKKYNNNVTFKALEGNHEMSYLKAEQDALIHFMKSNVRKPYSQISWECSNTTANTINGISIKSMDTLAKRQAWHEPYQLTVWNNQADFGIEYDYAYQGKGLKIKGFKSDAATGKKIGLQKEDIMLMMENDTIKNAYSPYFYTHKKRAGDHTTLTIEREGKTTLIEGKFNNGYPYEIFNHKGNSAKLMATFHEGKLSIKTSRVAEIEINFDEIATYNITQLEVNGKILPSSFKNNHLIQIN